jgi:hypothetical protein
MVIKMTTKDREQIIHETNKIINELNDETDFNKAILDIASEINKEHNNSINLPNSKEDKVARQAEL